jgi:hypothetical protein
MIAMPAFNSSDENIPTAAEACYEIIASQEEIFLEETEEELRAILIFDNPCPADSVDKPLDRAVEELITGDSDDPPLSDEEVVEMLRITQI